MFLPAPQFNVFLDSIISLGGIFCEIWLFTTCVFPMIVYRTGCYIHLKNYFIFLERIWIQRK